MLHELLTGFHMVMTFGNVFAIFLGVAFGVFMGAVPGLTGTMGIALIIPLTYSLSPITAFCALLGTYKGCLFGGAIPAILINTPGAPAAAVTVFDGFPLAQKGQAGQAMDIALWASVIADAFATICLIFLAVFLARISLKFGPPEYASLIVFSLCIVAGVSGDSMLKGIIAAVLGFLLGTVGLDPMISTPRFTFGFVTLFNGINMMVLMIGLFALSEVLVQSEKKGSDSRNLADAGKDRASWADIKRCLPTIFRGGVIGVLIGAIPGLGATPAAFLTYTETKRVSKHPEKFGHGAIEGVAASESGNNATCGGALIPLMALGIPGDVTTAVLLGAFLIHGLTPGPALFKENLSLVYSIFAALLIAIFFLPLVGRQFIRLFSLIAKVPNSIIYPVTTVLCTVGVFGFNSSYTDLWLMLFFGVMAYFMRKLGFPLAPMLIAFILEPIGERAIRQSLTLSRGSLDIFITRPISLVFLVLALISVIVLVRMKTRKSKENK
ncbi:tripartite tricarboxylate transporter permease [Desulfotignum balticum]|uniref:tripartite tricarboxylate transporter permease n=1 Tax=Desulfotignum balticum TaxID=115781 RepID=UPI0003F8DD47|nr:tripartite tricarboxylate transporter permease [Desulfotignum balticum]